MDVNTGRSKWVLIEEEWIELYRERKSLDGKSAVKKVDFKDEWLCEAHMKTDYSTLCGMDFEKTVREYYSYLIKDGGYIND